jgi:hypothetical protein
MPPPPAATTPGLATRPDRRCCDVHCNGLWSVWYGLLVVALQAFIVYKCVGKFLVYIALPWPDGRQPYLELNLYVGLVGAGLVLMPFFFIAFLFKVSLPLLSGKQRQRLLESLTVGIRHKSNHFSQLSGAFFIYHLLFQNLPLTTYHFLLLQTTYNLLLFPDYHLPLMIQ